VKPFGAPDLAERLTAYRELQHRMDALGTVPETDQADVDALFSAARPPAVPRVPAKGHSAPTLALLHQTLRGAHDALSAAEAAERTGVSRATGAERKVHGPATVSRGASRRRGPCSR
ncbi:hypothetical protein ACFXA1_38415, partial [Streptomyces sviceus]